MKRLVVPTAVVAAVAALAVAVMQNTGRSGDRTVLITSPAAPLQEAEAGTGAYTAPVPERRLRATGSASSVDVFSVAEGAVTVSPTHVPPTAAVVAANRRPDTRRWVRQEASLSGKYLNDVSFLDAEHG